MSPSSAASALRLVVMLCRLVPVAHQFENPTELEPHGNLFGRIQQQQTALKIADRRGIGVAGLRHLARAQQVVPAPRGIFGAVEMVGEQIEVTLHGLGALGFQV